MTPCIMVIDKIRRQDSREVIFSEHNHVIQAVAAQGADHPLAIGVLPRAPRSGSDLLDPERTQAVGEIFAIGGGRVAGLLASSQ